MSGVHGVLRTCCCTHNHVQLPCCQCAEVCTGIPYTPVPLYVLPLSRPNMPTDVATILANEKRRLLIYNNKRRPSWKYEMLSSVTMTGHG